VDGSGAGAASVDSTALYFYPQWGANGDFLTVMNNAGSAAPDPCTTVISLSGGVIQPNVNGNDSAGIAVFGGMPAVNPSNANLVTFAGQTAPSGAKYNQVRNYIYLNQLCGFVYSSAPMEPGAPIDRFDPAFQGRAPSDRASKNGVYALFLFDTQSQSAAIQLTDPAANPAQHAKFYPDGNQLIFCAQRSGHGGCIGSINISQ
jgi:hypothetical protein